MKTWQRCIVALSVLGGSVSVAAEEVELTTYYPSPRGVYEELRTTDDTFLATAAGNVGIGTSSPAARLHVASTGDAVMIRPTTMLRGDVADLVFADPDGGTTPMRLRYTDDGSPDLAILGGNVGIGIEDPGAFKLFINSGASSPLRVDSSAESLFSNSDDYLYIQPVYADDASGFVRVGAYDNVGASQGPRPLVLQPAGGNVGIGTTTPPYRLTVTDSGADQHVGGYDPTCCGGSQIPAGNFRGFTTVWDTDLAMVGLRDYGGDRKDLVLNTEQDSDNIRLQSAGTDVLFVGGSGNVGIGTTAPADFINWTGALDVNGQIRAAIYYDETADGPGPAYDYYVDSNVTSRMNEILVRKGTGTDAAVCDQLGRGCPAVTCNCTCP